MKVLVTGTSTGIGRGIAEKFLAEGHTVIGLDVAESTIAHENYAHYIADVACPEQLPAVDGVEILINNAGISHIGLLSDMTDEEWSRLIATNLSSAFYCCREAIPHMVSKKSGKILNVSSMWGRSGASCEAAYSASKAGIQGLTQALAKELAPSNIQVNAIAFGVIDTDMNRMLDAEERRALAEEIPAGYFASPEEAARMIWNTLNAPAYMTGQIIGFDGGFL